MGQNADIRSWLVDSPRALGLVLRDARLAMGKTQAELADLLGTTRQRLARIEQGDVSDQVLLIMTILKAAGRRLAVEHADVGEGGEGAA